MVNDNQLDDNEERSVVIVVDPFVERTIYNPSSTVSAVVYRATDGETKDVSLESQPTTRIGYKAAAAMVGSMADKGALTFAYLSSKLPFTKTKKDKGIAESLVV